VSDSRLSAYVVEQSTSLRETMRRIDRAETGQVAVVDEGRLVGTATDGDIRRTILEGTPLDAPVREAMTEEPVYLRQNWSYEEVTTALREFAVEELVPKHRQLLAPVLDGDDRVVDLAYVTRDGELAGSLDGTVPQVSDGTADVPPADGGGVSTVLVIGGAGYVGSVLVRTLLGEGYRVKVLDNLTYGDHGIAELYGRDRFRFIEGNMGSIDAILEAIKGVDAVVHLGALVGDPASAIDPQTTLELNYHAVEMAASVCKYHQVNRFIFASTCSVYGESPRPGALLTEDSAVKPVSLYAKSKLESERALLGMEDENFSPTVFRMATVYGLSARMRFDLVVNILSAKAHEENTVPIFGGDQYRPNVHVADAARAYVDCLEAPISTVSGEVYNVGSTEQNYRIIEVGRIVASCFPDAEIDRRPEQEDDRTYRVDFSKINGQLGFEPDHTIAACCRELRDALQAGRFDDVSAPRYNNYKTLQGSNPVFEAEEEPEERTVRT
jgi:nucleoside-diphosphate-sugar epimerase